MRHTTRRLCEEIGRLNRLIARIAARPVAEWPVWSQTLADLRAERDLLMGILADRRLEGGKKVVNLALWCGGRSAA